jgi:quinol monooxygenase YgiN
LINKDTQGRIMRQAFQLMLALVPFTLASAPAAHAQAAADPTVYVVRYIEATPAAQEKSAGLLKQLVDASRKEAGAVRFDVLQRAAPAGHFATFEVWKDQASLDAHVAAAHKQFLDAAQPLLIAPVDDRPCIAFDMAPAQSAAGAIYAITHVDVAPPNREAGIALIKTVAGPNRKESGNLGFYALQQTARTNHFEVVEIWKDQQAVDAHEVDAATKDYRAKVQPLLGAHYDRRWYKSL